MTDPVSKKDEQISRLVDIMARLRNPDGGCPWDVEQTFATIAPYTVEEAYEVAEAIARGDMGELKDELGDLLLQVVFHARMAEEAGLFDFDDVAGAIADKMVRRHPHVFGDDAYRDAAAQTVAWEAMKAEERARKNSGDEPDRILDGVAHALPALMRAQKLGKRAARHGFDWHEAAAVVDKIREELDEVIEEIPEGDDARLEHEIGDLLFAVVQLGRKLGVDAEEALRACNRRFERRFRTMEDDLREAGENIERADMVRLEAAWQAAKRADRQE